MRNSYSDKKPVSKGLPAFFIARMGEGAAFRVGVKDGTLPVFDEGDNLFYFATSIVMSYCYRCAISSRLKPVAFEMAPTERPISVKVLAVSRAFW